MKNSTCTVAAASLTVSAIALMEASSRRTIHGCTGTHGSCVKAPVQPEQTVHPNRNITCRQVRNPGIRSVMTWFASACTFARRPRQTGCRSKGKSPNR